MSKSIAEEGVQTADLARIMRMIPHRYPFLMIDKVVDIRVGESAVGIKNVTITEPHFQGHFPTEPIMPGVLVVEAMAQTAGVLVVETLGKIDENLLVSFSGIVTFRGAATLREVARALPLERILVETDAPFLAPEGRRGKRNEPAWVTLVGEAIARLRGIDAGDLARATTENARRFYRLPAEAA